MSKDFVDYYALLGIETDASSAELRTCFLRMAKMHHPDVGGSNQQMQLLSIAYRTLQDTKKRSAYDQVHSMHTSTSAAAYIGFGSDDPAAGSAAYTNDHDTDAFLDELWNELSATKPRMSLIQRIKNKFV